MAESQKELLIVLRSIFESQGYKDLAGATDEVAKKSDDLNESHKRGEGAAHDQEMGFDKLKEKALELAAEYLAVKEAWEFLSESFKLAVEKERDFARLGAAMETMAGATHEEVEATQEWLEAAERQYGVVGSELIPAFQRFITVTHDTKEAQALTLIALNASKAGFADLGEATNTLSMMMVRGEVVGRGPFATMLRQIVDESKKAHKGHVDHLEVLTKLNDRMNDTAAKLHTTSGELNKNKVSWEQTKEAVGALGLGLVETFTPALKIAAIGLSMVVAGLMDIGAALKYAWDLFTLPAKIAEYNKQGMGVIEATRRAMKDANQSFSDTAAKGTEVITNVMTAWDRNTASVQMGAKVQGDALKGLANLWERSGQSVKDNSKEQEKLENERLQSLLKHSKMERGVAEEKLESMENDEKRRRQMAEQREKWDDIQMERRRVTGKLTDKEELGYLKEKERRLLEESKAVGLSVEDQIKLQEKLLANEQKIAQKEKQIEQQRIAARKAMTKAMLGLGKQMAGQNTAAAKEMQHIEAGVALFEGITGSMKGFNQAGGYPTGVPSLVAGLATTATEVASIEGIGFDDPANDAIMRAASRKWAMDMARETMLGHAQGWQEGLDASRGQHSQTTINNQITNPGSTHHTRNFYISAAVLDTGRDQTLRDLSVKLREIDSLTNEGKVR